MSKTAISQNIQRLLKERGWNESELSRYSGVRQSTVHRIANGVTENPRTDSVKEIAKAFNVSYAEITNQGDSSAVGEDSNDYSRLTSGAKKLIATVHALADRKISDEDYQLLCKLLERFSEK